MSLNESQLPNIPNILIKNLHFPNNHINFAIADRLAEAPVWGQSGRGCFDAILSASDEI